MYNISKHLAHLILVILIAKFLCFCSAPDYLVIHPENPDHFDVIRGRNYKGFVAPKKTTFNFDMDSVCRFTPSPKEISKAEKIINAKFYDIEDSLRYRFADLDQYWRTYVGRYKDCLAPSGIPKNNRIIVILFDHNRMPQYLDQIWDTLSEEAINYFMVYVDLNTGHVSIPDFSTSIRPIYLPLLRPSKTKSKNGIIVYEVKEWKPSEK